MALGPIHHIQLSHGPEGLVLPSDLVKRPKTAKSSIIIHALIHPPSTVHNHAHQPQNTNVFASPNIRDPGSQPGHPPRVIPSHSPTPLHDPGDPAAVLAGKGITEGNKTDISALATALQTFGDFKHGTT